MIASSGPALGRASRAATLMGWNGFAALTLVLRADPPTDVDHDVQMAVAHVAARVLQVVPGTKGLSTAVAHLGAASVLVPVLVTLGLGWWFLRRTIVPGVFLGASYLLMVGVVSAAKGLLARPEPYDSALDLGRSFPSGHVASAVVVWGGAAACWWAWSGRPHQRRTAAAAGAVVIAVAATMVARSAHWLSDVLAGAALGVACLGTVGTVLTWRNRREVVLTPPAVGTTTP